jgi:hypothetical protein
MKLTQKVRMSPHLFFSTIFIIYASSYLYTINNIYEVLLPPKGIDPYIYDLVSDIAKKDLLLKDIHVYFLSPIYLYFYLIIKFFIYDTPLFYKTIILINHILYFISGIIFYKISYHYSHSNNISLLSYLVYALNPISIFYTSIPVKDILAVSLFTIFIYLLINHKNIIKHIITAAIIAGIILGMRGNFISVIVITAMYIYFRNNNINYSLIFLAIAISIILPFTIRNYLISKQFIPLYTGSGMHLYIANNENSTGSYKKIEGIEPTPLGHYFDAKKLAEKELNKKLNDKEVNEFYKFKAYKFIKNNPKQAISLYIKKIMLLISSKELSNNYDYNFFKHTYTNIRLFSYSHINFGIIFILGITGLLFFKYEHKYYLLSMLFMLFLSNVMIFITGRYRFIMYPILHLGVTIFLINLTKIRVKEILFISLMIYFSFYGINDKIYYEQAKVKFNNSLRSYVLYLRDKSYLKKYKEEQINYFNKFKNNGEL